MIVNLAVFCLAVGAIGGWSLHGIKRAFEKED